MEPVAWPRRTWWSFILVILALALGTVVVSGTGAPTDDGNGSPLDDGIWETEGDWTVEASEVYENLTMRINGNITVNFTGRLTLRGVRMIMILSEPHEFGIRVLTGGEMVVEDTDGDPATTNDRSDISSSYPDLRYYIQIDGGAKMSVLRSKVSTIGDEDTVGLTIESDDVRIEHSIFDNFVSIFVDGSDPEFISTTLTGDPDILSSLYFFESGAKVTNCLVTNCFYGINVFGTPSPELQDTKVANCFYPLNLEQATVTMRGGMLETTQYGVQVRLNQTSTATLFDVQFDPMSVRLLDDASTLEVRWTLTLQVTDQAYQPLEGASVKVNDSRGQNAFDGTAGADGTLIIELLDRIQSSTGNETRNPYTIRVDKGRYHGVAYVDLTRNLNKDIVVLTNLAPVVSVKSPTPGTRVVMGQTMVFDASPTYDPNGDPMTFTWVSDRDRPIYTGSEAVVEGSLLWGESGVILTVSDGEGGENSTTIVIEVVQASQVLLTVLEIQFNASLDVVYGGDGQVLFEKAEYPQPHPPELIGIFLRIHVTDQAILATGDMIVRYSPLLLPYGMSEGSLSIAREDGGIWIDLPDSEVDVINHLVTGTVRSPGIYTVKGIMPANVPPRLWMQVGDQLVPPTDVKAPSGSLIDMLFIVEDELPAFARLTVEDLPSFLRIDGSTKRIAGTAPTTADRYRLALWVTDVGGLTDHAIIYLNVTGSVSGPQLWSGVVSPSEGDTYTNFEIKVVYMNPNDLAPIYVRAVFKENETVDLIPINITDTDYRSGVMYHAFVRLSKGSHDIRFESSDGVTTNSTTVPIKATVHAYTIEVSDLEWGIIIATLLATFVIIIIIRMTSARYTTLKEAHYGLDQEDSVEYISPEKAEPDAETVDTGEEGEGDTEGEDEDPTPDDEGDEGPVSEDGEDAQVVTTVDEDDMKRLEEDVDRLDGELGELDDQIDQKEEELARIDEEIEEIIDELDEDREKAS